MPRPPDHPPLRHLMADNREKTPHATVPCPLLPDAAYETSDPVSTALARGGWAITTDTTDTTGFCKCGLTPEQCRVTCCPEGDRHPIDRVVD